MRLRLLTATVLTAGLALAACGETAPDDVTAGAPPEVVTSGDCANERALVLPALRASRVRTDVSGDGRLDTVAVASQPRAAKPCRAFVAVRVSGGSTYSTHLFGRAAPIKGLEAELAGLPRLGDQTRAQVVVDTKAAADSLLAQMFTLADGALRVVRMPGSSNGTFIVEGGGVIYPFAAACTEDGRMVLSRAAQTSDGERFRVVRRTYDVVGERTRLVDPVRERASVPVGRLLDRFPEFGRPHWKACTGTVRR